MMAFLDDVRWLAGLLDGEGYFRFGCIGRKDQLRKSMCAVVGLGMTDRDLVERAHQLLGARVSIRTEPAGKHRRTKPIYSFMITGPKAIGWMYMLYPFLGQRRQAKIREIIAAWRARPPAARYRIRCPRGHPYDLVRRPYHKGRVCSICQRAHQRIMAERRRRARGIVPRRRRSSYADSPAQLRLLYWNRHRHCAATRARMSHFDRHRPRRDREKSLPRARSVSQHGDDEPSSPVKCSQTPKKLT
jgi:hypothetical protein